MQETTTKPLAPTGARPTLMTAVVMRREPVSGPMSRWQAWRWVLADVVTEHDMPELAQWTAGPGPFEMDGPQGEAEPPQAGATHWLYPGFPVELFRDDAEGYYLNLTAPQPCFWVMWRPDAEGDAAPTLVDGEPAPMPQIVTLSYHDAGRWLDAQEKVDQVPASARVCEWLAAFVNQHYQPEPKRRQRPQSFQTLTDRFGNPVRISTEAKRKGGGNPGGPRGG